MLRAEGWESSSRIEVLSEARVGALAILARADSKEFFSHTSCAASAFCTVGCPCLRLSLSQARWLLLLPSTLPDTANDNQLIQHNLVHYKLVDW